LHSLRRCLVSSVVTKHLVFRWMDCGPIFSGNLHVWPIESDRALAVLQSRVHETWARRQASTLEDRLKYVLSSCFETFPFPRDAAFSALDAIGERLDRERKGWMTSQSQGLTTTYNRLKDPTETTPGILSLRALHEELDREVLAA